MSPRAYAWSLCMITWVVLAQPITISTTLDCVTKGEIVVRPYDGSLLRRPELTITMG